MKIFIDSADINEIKEANALGVIDGVTTNPSLVAKTGKDFETVINEIVAEVDGPISAEAVSQDANGLIAEGRKLSKIHENIVVKIPMTTEGLKAVHTLSDEGIKTNVTLVFSPTQAMLAAKAGATYASPFVGRLDDISQNGMELIFQIIEIFNNYAYETELIVASIRHPLHVVESAQMGADVATIPLAVIKRLTEHPLTDIGIERFLTDWKKVPKV